MATLEKLFFYIIVRNVICDCVVRVFQLYLELLILIR